MARVTIPIIVPKGPHPGVVAPEDLDFVRTAADPSNLNQFIMTGRELLLVRNDDVGAQTVSLLTVNDPFKRKADITTYSLGISEEMVFWFGDVQGWLQTGGFVFIDPSDADLKFAVIRIPG